jgi:tripartite-type tricarboxylate transporter receptor subunit TctC
MLGCCAQKIHAARCNRPVLSVVLREPDVHEEFIQRQGLIPVDSAAPDELRTFVQAEIARLGDIVRKAGLAGSE